MKHRRITPMDAAALFCAAGFLVTGGLTLRDLLRSTREDAAKRRRLSRRRRAPIPRRASCADTNPFPAKILT